MKTNKDQELEARRILDRVAQESETVGTSSMSRVADRVKNHMRADDADEADWAEVWGTRIGRGIGVVFFFVLLIYMLNTYVFNG